MLKRFRKSHIIFGPMSILALLGLVSCMENEIAQKSTRGAGAATASASVQNDITDDDINHTTRDSIQGLHNITEEVTMRLRDQYDDDDYDADDQYDSDQVDLEDEYDTEEQWADDGESDDYIETVSQRDEDNVDICTDKNANKPHQNVDNVSQNR